MSPSARACSVSVIFDMGCVRVIRLGGILPRRPQRHRSFCVLPRVCSIDAHVQGPALTNWHPASWHTRPATQQPKYADPVALERAVAALSRLPPLVVSWEVEALRAKLAQAQRGEQFLLQGGDCAESFEDCESDNIAKRLKILLQMSLVLLQGLEEAHHSRRPFRRPVRQAALGGHRDPRRRYAALLSGRQRQPARLQRRGARTGSGTACCAAMSAPRSR